MFHVEQIGPVSDDFPTAFHREFSLYTAHARDAERRVA